MSRHKILCAATSVAVIAFMGSNAVAQTNVQLPAELNALGLENVRSDEQRGGILEIEGRTANGLEIEAHLDAQGKLVSAEVDNGPMPQSLLDAILPQAVRSNDAMTQFAIIESVGIENGGFDVQGEDSTGREIFALFGQDGSVLRSGHDD